MDLHINYETQAPYPLERKDADLTPKTKAETRPLGSVSLFDDQSTAEQENTLLDSRVSAFVPKPRPKLRAVADDPSALRLEVSETFSKFQS